MSEPILTPEDREVLAAALDTYSPIASAVEAIVARHRVVAAEAARAELVASITALADEWDAMFPEAGRWHRHAAQCLRALAVPDHARPTGDTTHP